MRLRKQLAGFGAAFLIFLSTALVYGQPIVQPVPPVVETPPNASPTSAGPNVRVETTIKDEEPGKPLVTKVVSVVVASGHQGRVRTLAQGLRLPAPLNVDAHPEVTQHGRIVLRLSLEYGLPGENAAPNLPRADGAQEKNTSSLIQTIINESIAVVLENGKPMTVTQSADPVTDRKVTVEVKATILK